MLFYNNFDAICKQRGTSASAAAMAIGRSKGAASNWKTNGTLPKEDELIALSNHLNCYVSDFFRMPGEELSEYAQMLEDLPVGTFGKKLDPEIEEEPLDDYQNDFLTVYDSLSPKDRMRLMNLIYEFADEKGVEL